MTSTIKADIFEAATTNGVTTIRGNGTNSVAIADNTAITGTATVSSTLGVTGASTLTGATTISGQAYPTAGGLWSGRNMVINGEMKISQRGTQTDISANTYTTDRWQLQAAGAGRSEVSVSTEVPNNNFVVSAKIDVTTADTSIGATDLQSFTQRLEGTTIARLGLGTASAKAFSVSFWVRSTKTGTFCVSIRNPSGTRSIASEYTISATNTWEHKKINFAGDTSGTYNTNTSEGFGLNFILVAGSNYNGKTADTWEANTQFSTNSQVNAFDSDTNDFYITGIQLEAGESTPFEHELLSETLQKCQRYYTSQGAGVTGYWNGGTNMEVPFQFFPPMRATPTVTIGNSAPSISNKSNSSTGTQSSVAVVNSSGTANGFYFVQINNCNTSTSPSAGHIGQFRTDNFMNFSAEL